MQFEREFTAKQAHLNWKKIIEKMGILYTHKTWYSNDLQLCITECELYDSNLGKKVSVGMGKGRGLKPILGSDFESLEHYFYEHQCHGNKKMKIKDIKLQDIKLSKDPALNELKDIKENKEVIVDKFINYNTQKNIYYPAFLNDTFFKEVNVDDKNHAYNYSSDNGFASGSTFDEAFLHSINELIERDTVSKFLLKYSMKMRIRGIKAYTVNYHTLPKNLKKLYVTINETTGGSLKLIELSNMYKIPTFLAIIQRNGKLLPIYGSGTSLSSLYAAERALTEAFQLFCIKDENESVELNKKLNKLCIVIPSLRNIISFSFIGNLDEGTFRNEKIFKKYTVSSLLKTEIARLQSKEMNIFYRSIIDEKGFCLMQTLIPGFEKFNMILEGQVVLPTL